MQSNQNAGCSGKKLWGRVGPLGRCLWAVGGYYLEPAVGIFITATDAGPDQVAAHRQIDFETSGDPFTWILRQWCLQHQLHLIVKYSLALTRKMARGVGDLPPFIFAHPENKH